MSDYWPANITLWPFPAEPSERLLSSLAEGGIEPEVLTELLQGGGDGEPDANDPSRRTIYFDDSEYVLRSDALRGLVLQFSDHQARNGCYQFTATTIRETLQAAGIAYMIADDGYEDYDGEEYSWHPGMDGERLHARMSSGDCPLTPAEFVKLKVKALTKNTHVSAEKLGELVAAHFQYDPLDWWPGKPEQFEIELPPELKPGPRGRKSSLAAD